SIVMLASIGWVSYRSVATLSETSLWVTHTHVVLEHLVQVLRYVVDAETNQRGYIITGEEALLTPYHLAVEGVTHTLKELRELTADNPRQQKGRDEREPLVRDRMAVLLHNANLRKQNGFDATATALRGGEGLRAMEAVRRQLTDMEADERQLLKERA